MRWMSLRLPELGIERSRPRAETASTSAPRALAARDGGRELVVAVDEAARAYGVRCGHTAAAARALCSPEYRDNPAIFPPADIIAKSEGALYLGEERVRLIKGIRGTETSIHLASYR